MDIIQAHKLAEELISTTWTVNYKEYNLSDRGWKFGGFDKAVKRLGICRGSRKEIGLSRKPTMFRTEEEVKQTILHEIGHAIDREIRGTSKHDHVWLNIAQQVGYKGKRTTAITQEVRYQLYNWFVVCDEHGIIGGWVRKPQSYLYSCKKCKKYAKFLNKVEVEKLGLL